MRFKAGCVRNKTAPDPVSADRVGCSARCIDAVSSNGQDTLSRITEAQHHHIKQ